MAAAAGAARAGSIELAFCGHVITVSSDHHTYEYCDWYSYVWCTVIIHRDAPPFIIASYRELEGSKRTLASGTYPECAYSRPRH